MKSKSLIFLMVFTAFSISIPPVISQELYQPKLPKERDIEKIKINLENNLKSSYIYCSASAKLPPLHSDNLIPVNVLVFEDRFELTFKRKNTQIFYFKDLIDFNITAMKTPFAIINGVFGKLNTGEKLETRIGNQGTIYIYTEINNTNIADDLFYIRYHLIESKLEGWLNDFKPVAEKYRSLTEKPTISEEQREYIVQANFFTQQKNYNKAIELYQKVYQIYTYSYPAAYSNLALLYANMSDYQSAIYYMKLYLMLEPDANDARASQDKIYEWKAML
ncbi:MAG: tetratricopeptide repeat protein [Flavobacteriaceae bacterium]|nr:tetratricopeptide repeat protein [Flavobacteriaceae bacterium]